MVSTSGKRSNGSTASFTAMWPPPAGGWSSTFVAQLGKGRAHHHPAAAFASGTPVALLTNGTVRLARGLASIT